jgi:hypothetical protein
MPADPSDIHTTIEYRMDAEVVRLLPTGLLAVFAGLAIFALASPEWPDAKGSLAAIGGLVAGIGIIAASIWRFFRRGRPLFVLSPQGIHLRTWKRALIPWREIRGIDTVEIEARIPTYRSHSFFSWRPVIFSNVTVFLVPRQFYERRIHVRSFILRGPGWHANFRPRGDLMECALHHELVSVTPRALRAAVEARWHAFRGEDGPRTSVPIVSAAGEAAAPAAPGARVVAAGDNPRTITPWEWVKIIVPLIGIAVVATNLAGVWRTEAQAAAFAKQREWAEQTARWARERKELDERLAKQRKELDDHWRRFDAQRWGTR